MIRTRSLAKGGWVTPTDVLYADLHPGAEIRFAGIGLVTIVGHYGECGQRAEYVQVSDGIHLFVLRAFEMPKGGYGFLLTDAPVSHYDATGPVLYMRQ